LLYKPKLKLCQDSCACIMCRAFFEHVDNLNFPKDEYVCEVDTDISGCYVSKELKTLESYSEDNLLYIDPPQTKMEWGGFRVVEQAYKPKIELCADQNCSTCSSFHLRNNLEKEDIYFLIAEMEPIVCGMYISQADTINLEFRLHGEPLTLDPANQQARFGGFRVVL
jgi:hypothetical protein